MEWYALGEVTQTDTPAVVIYEDRVKENIRATVLEIGDVQRLRPHVKTCKIREVVQLMQDAGINKFKCATIAEAEMLGMQHAADVLLAYQPIGPKVNRLLQLVQQYPDTRFSCITDHKDAAAALAAAFAAHGLELPVYVDINIGMNRTGIVPEHALELYLYLQLLDGITPVGLHAYDGHLHDTDMDIRKERCDAAFAPVEKLAADIQAAGIASPVIVAGGSNTFPIHARRAAVECSPGTFVFWDWGYAHMLPEQHLQYAALVITRVISIIDDHRICLDLGHKSVAAENPLPRVHFLNVPEGTPVSQSEEHLVLKVPDSSKFPLGTVLYGVPVHICPTIALYEKAVVAKDHHVNGSWRIIARDRAITV